MRVTTIQIGTMRAFQKVQPFDAPRRRRPKGALRHQARTHAFRSCAPARNAQLRGKQSKASGAACWLVCGFKVKVRAGCTSQGPLIHLWGREFQLVCRRGRWASTMSKPAKYPGPRNHQALPNCQAAGRRQSIPSMRLGIDGKRGENKPKSTCRHPALPLPFKGKTRATTKRGVSRHPGGRGGRSKNFYSNPRREEASYPFQQRPHTRVRVPLQRAGSNPCGTFFWALFNGAIGPRRAFSPSLNLLARSVSPPKFRMRAKGGEVATEDTLLLRSFGSFVGEPGSPRHPSPRREAHQTLF
jgi:hypothetical protein